MLYVFFGWQAKEFSPFILTSQIFSSVFGFKHREHFRYSVCNNDEVISSIT